MPATTLASLQKHFEALQERVANLEAKWSPSIAQVAVLAAAVAGLVAWQATAQSSISDLEGKVSALEEKPSAETPPPPKEETSPVEEVPPPVEEPNPLPSACTSTVTSLGSVQAGMGAGKVVCIADGSYGSLSITGPGTVTAQHPGKVTITGAKISGTGARLDRVLSTGSVQFAVGSKDATLSHSTITGGGQGVDVCPSTTTPCTNITITGNRLVGPFGEDAIHSNRTEGLTITENEITKVAENGNHSDCYQNVWVSSNIVYRRNYVHDNRCQGFFVKDQASLPSSSATVGPINGIAVEDNLMIRNHEPCAIAGCGQPVILQIFGPYTGLKIKRNTLWGDGYDSMLALREGVGAGTVIEGNVIYRFWTDTNASGATFANNTACVIEGSWPASRPGTETTCSSATPAPAGRGIDWNPAEVHYGV